MRKRNIKLFDKTIHEVKKIVQQIKSERDSHNIKLNELINEAVRVVDELYKLFDGLCEEKKGE